MKKKRKVSKANLIKRYTKAKKAVEDAQARGYKFSKATLKMLSQESVNEQLINGHIDRGYYNRLAKYTKAPEKHATSYRYLSGGKMKTIGLKASRNAKKEEKEKQRKANLARAKKIEAGKPKYDKDYVINKILERLASLQPQAREAVKYNDTPLLYSAKLIDKKAGGARKRSVVEYTPAIDFKMIASSLGKRKFSDIENILNEIGQLITKIEAINYYEQYINDVINPVKSILTGEDYDTEYNPYESDEDPYGLDKEDDEDEYEL